VSGYTYGEHEPTENCPYCNTVCRADFVDVGVGMTQCGPYHCENCHASEIGPYDQERVLSTDEQRTGWYAPESEPGSSVNVIGGRIVSHVQMRETYRQEFVGNPMYEVPGYVENWFDEIRKGGR